MTGTVFSVKEMAVHDGPGIRTTVFLKGCPLRCRWCHNPEGLSPNPELAFHSTRCLDCGACKQACDHPECKPFGRCLHICPSDCLEVMGRRVEATDLANEIITGAKVLGSDFGGVTFSGGEPLMQADFLLEMTELLKGYHLAIETCGYASAKVFKNVISRMDYVIMDIKLADDVLHQRYTRKSNQSILQNYNLLRESGVPFVIRTPLIPNITDTEENLRAIADLIKGDPWEKLPYNELAGAKYAMLGKVYDLYSRKKEGNVMQNKEIVSWVDDLSEARKKEIRNMPDTVVISHNTYYVSAIGDDNNNGTSPDSAWRTINRVNQAELTAGDGVLFRRGDTFRGGVYACEGVTYAAYGQGEKPKILGWIENLADESLWELHDAEHHIWKYKKLITDCGTLVFNEGPLCSRKLIPSYKNGFVCRDDETRRFLMSQEMTNDLDIFCLVDCEMTEVPSKGENFPVPVAGANNFGTLYLRCDKGNPGSVFSSIEAVATTHLIRVGGKCNVTVENLCLKYGVFGVSAGSTRGLTVRGCEIGWIGGNVQHYSGTDPNYPQGRRGTVTRFGNGVEVFGSCNGYSVTDCYIYQCYDAGVTHQKMETDVNSPTRMINVCYRGNLIEHCVYGIEYFLDTGDGDFKSIMDGIEMSDNILRFSGYGWGQQRHNTDTPAHIKGWSYTNPAKNYTVHDNIFDRSAYRMLHIVAKQPESCPEMYNNTYIQYHGNLLGQFGANEKAEPPILPFDEKAATEIATRFGDKNARVYPLPFQE